jgi:hypothetical protein
MSGTTAGSSLRTRRRSRRRRGHALPLAGNSAGSGHSLAEPAGAGLAAAGPCVPVGDVPRRAGPGGEMVRAATGGAGARACFA